MTSTGVVPFEIVTGDTNFAITGRFVGQAIVTADSVIAFVTEGSARAHPGLRHGAVTNVRLMAELGMELAARDGGGWTTVASSPELPVRDRLAPGEQATLRPMYLAMPRPRSYRLANYWLVLTFVATEPSGREFTTYSHARRELFARF